MIYLSFLSAILFRSWKVIRSKSDQKLPELTHYMKHPVSFPPSQRLYIYMCCMYIWLINMDIFILPRCHQQPTATNLCGFYVLHHMNISLSRIATSKDVKDWVCMQNIFSSIEILICTGSDMIQFT